MSNIGSSLLGAVLLAAPAGVNAEAAYGADAPKLVFAFEEDVTLGPDIHVGETALGRRNIVPITGGTFAGPGIQGTILPGGWDWQLVRNDGCVQIEANYMLRTDDGVVINVINKGVACPPGPGSKPTPLRTTPVFEAPRGKYEWLGKSAFVGTLEPGRGGATPSVHIRFFRAE